MNGWQIMFLIAAVCFGVAAGLRDPKDGMSPDIARLLLAAIVSLLFVGLTACSTPALKDRIVEVAKPVAVQPITPAQVPTPPTPLPKRPSSLSAAADVLLSKICELEAYVLRADPLLRVSAGMPQQPLAKYPECE